MKKETLISPKKFHYSFVALLFTFLAILSFCIVPLDVGTGLSFAVSTALGVFFSYKSIQKKEFSDKLVGAICFLMISCLLALFVFTLYW